MKLESTYLFNVESLSDAIQMAIDTQFDSEYAEKIEFVFDSERGVGKREYTEEIERGSYFCRNSSTMVWLTSRIGEFVKVECFSDVDSRLIDKKTGREF